MDLSLEKHTSPSGCTLRIGCFSAIIPWWPWYNYYINSQALGIICLCLQYSKYALVSVSNTTGWIHELIVYYTNLFLWEPAIHPWGLLCWSSHHIPCLWWNKNTLLLLTRQLMMMDMKTCKVVTSYSSLSICCHTGTGVIVWAHIPRVRWFPISYSYNNNNMMCWLTCNTSYHTHTSRTCTNKPHENIPLLAFAAFTALSKELKRYVARWLTSQQDYNRMC